MQARIMDMTKGRPGRLILSFALPLMLGNVFQQLYTMVDTMVVGKFVGVEALAALGAADWLNWMMLGLATGFTQGFGILIAQRFGSGDQEGLKRSIAMSYLLSAIIAIVMTAAALLLARPVLNLLNTPDNVMPLSLNYLYICYCGIFVIVAYNIFSTVLRSLGDSRTPLVAMIIAAMINIALDLLFVRVFNWGVGGAAFATVIAQTFSGAYCFLSLRKLAMIKLEKSHFSPDFQTVGRLFALGTPMAFQNAVISVGGMVVQRVINGFGFIFMAGFTATNKLYGLLELAATSFGAAMATFTGQNLGAGKPERIRQGMRAAILMALVTSAVISIVMVVFGRSIISLFISGEQTEAVIKIAYEYLVVMSVPLFILYLLHLYRCALQGMGDTVVPMITGIVELIMRVAVAIFLPRVMGSAGIYYAEATAWLGAELILMFTYYYRIGKLDPRKPAISEGT